MTATTDATGFFILEDLPAPEIFVLIDGSNGGNFQLTVVEMAVPDPGVGPHPRSQPDAVDQVGSVGVDEPDAGGRAIIGVVVALDAQVEEADAAGSPHFEHGLLARACLPADAGALAAVEARAVGIGATDAQRGPTPRVGDATEAAGVGGMGAGSAAAAVSISELSACLVGASTCLTNSGKPVR